MSQVYLIRRRDNGRHVGYATDHCHVWDDKTRAMFYVCSNEPLGSYGQFVVEEYTLRPTWLQRIKWFLAWVTG